MSEDGIDDLKVEATAVPMPIPAGRLLREAREAQGLHMGALAVALKVPVKKLEALEAGRYDELPNMMFGRALAMSICRILKIDPTQIMASLPEQQVSPFKLAEPSLNTTYRDSVAGSHSVNWIHLTSPIGLGVVLLLIVILAVVLWPNGPAMDSATVAWPNRFGGIAQNVPPLLELAPHASSPASRGEPAQTPSSPTSSSEISSTVGSVVTPAGAVNPYAVSDMATQPTILEFAAHGVSWVEVFDAVGQSKLRKLTVDGDVLRVSGQLPLSVVVGRADQITVIVRGKPLDITALAKDNVARFEVK